MTYNCYDFLTYHTCYNYKMSLIIAVMFLVLNFTLPDINRDTLLTVYMCIFFYPSIFNFLFLYTYSTFHIQ